MTRNKLRLMGKQYICALGIFLVLDAVWLGVVAKSLYKDELGNLMANEPRLWAALIFYLLFVVGLVYFVLSAARSARQAALDGALFGFMTYMTYDLTNYAVIEGWPGLLVPIDIMWGTILAGSVCYLSFKLLNRQ
jgi:uncharacterized membrane protein